MKIQSAAATSTEMPALLSLAPWCEFVGRVLLCLLFLISGTGKIVTYAEIATYMSSHGVPAVLLPAVIATEALGGLAVALGWKTRIVAFFLAGYSLLTALIFHHDFSDQIQMLMFLKNVSIAGGFLLVLANGAGPISLDARQTRDSAD
jgi:putative oxidoreductase